MLLSQKIRKLPALSGKQMNRRRLWRHLKNRPSCLDGSVADFRTTDFAALTMHRGEQILLCLGRRASPVIADLTVQIGQFLLQGLASLRSHGPPPATALPIIAESAMFKLQGHGFLQSA